MYIARTHLLLQKQNNANKNLGMKIQVQDGCQRSLSSKLEITI